MTTHYLEEAESLCRNIAIIDSGNIVEHTSVRSLLKTLNSETFVLDLREPLLGEMPLVEGFSLRLAGPLHLEVDVVKGQALGDVFAALSKAEIDVVSMRNKTNRLEELFVSLTGDTKEVSGEA